jgi:hypothetical protein
MDDFFKIKMSINPKVKIMWILKIYIIIIHEFTFQ